LEDQRGEEFGSTRLARNERATRSLTVQNRLGQDAFSNAKGITNCRENLASSVIASIRLIPNAYSYRRIQMKIAELRAGMRRVDISAKVTEVSDTRDVTTRTGEQMKVATAVVNDESGSVKLTLWNEQIGQVRVDNTVKVENGYVTSFRGEIQLNVGRYGKLTVE